MPANKLIQQLRPFNLGPYTMCELDDQSALLPAVSGSTALALAPDTDNCHQFLLSHATEPKAFVICSSPFTTYFHLGHYSIPLINPSPDVVAMLQEAGWRLISHYALFDNMSDGNIVPENVTQQAVATYEGKQVQEWDLDEQTILLVDDVWVIASEQDDAFLQFNYADNFLRVANWCRLYDTADGLSSPRRIYVPQLADYTREGSQCTFLNPDLPVWTWPASPVYLVGRIDPSEDLLALVEDAIQQARGAGQRVLLTYTTGLGENSLTSNCAGSDWCHIELPGGNVAQFRTSVGLDSDVDMIPYPYSLSLIEVARLIHKVDQYYEPIYYPFYQTDVFRTAWSKTSVGCHSLAATQVEKLRSHGKQLADQLGIPQARWGTLGSEQDWADLRKSLFAADTRVVLKYEKNHFIGVYPIDRVAALIPDLLAKDKLVVEEYLGDGTDEINYSFLIHDDFVVPILRLREVNKLFPNGMGGKTGLTAAVHSNKLDDFSLVLADKLRGLRGLIDGRIFGWVDLSFMRCNGQLWFTEWMVRSGGSNNAIINHMLKTPFPELLDRLHKRTLTTQEIEWHDPLSLAVELFSIPLSAGNDIAAYWETQLQAQQRIPNSRNGLHVDTLEWLSEMEYDGGSLAIVNYNNRMAVVTATGNDYEDMASRIRAYVDTLSIPYLAYRNDFDNMKQYLLRDLV